MSAAHSEAPRLAPETFANAVRNTLIYALGRFPQHACREEWYSALALVVRGIAVQGWQALSETLSEKNGRAVAYLSAEFLLGPHLGNALLSLGMTDIARSAMILMDQDLDDLIASEEEPGLGNGGLGRLAACYLDSMATLRVPVIGYGIRYEFGIFDQAIRDGWQVESTDNWLHHGNPWEVPRPRLTYSVGFGGWTQSRTDEHGRYRVEWYPERMVRGVASDTPIPGYRTGFSARLRLWKAEAHNSFDFAAFNSGDYLRAVEEKVATENISKVLYPNDASDKGKALRLQQQYFFVSCSLQDMIRLTLARGSNMTDFHKQWAIQLNDTHPAIAVAELMRLLMDKHNFGWNEAWAITQRSCHYTNHTLLPEALEKWGLSLFANLLPRHLEIIYEINARFLEQVKKKYPGDHDRVSRMSLIDETGERYVRMANLATVGSRRVNGVAAMHTELLKQQVLHDFAEMTPEKFVNVTNGVTPRRWIALANPKQASLISSVIGEDWLRNLDSGLTQLEPFANDASFRTEWDAVQLACKENLAEIVRAYANVDINPVALLDAQVKRIHEYKRQHLNVLHILTLYNRLIRDPGQQIVPRTFLFGGKAAPGYFMAKLIIKLIHAAGELVNFDSSVAGRLRVCFLPDYNVKHSQHVYPAADLSEQISTAGKEASGTGNMKFALNGALTIGTLDGANVEIREAVGPENFFLFGLTAEGVATLKEQGYRPRSFYDNDPELRDCLEVIERLGPEFRPLLDNLLHDDPFLVLADYRSYVDCQDKVSEAWMEGESWTRKSILNTARCGRFSSDRSIKDYAREIWQVPTF